MICPRCSVAEISPLTNRCELCGYAPAGGIAVEAQSLDAADELARRELGDRFHFDALLGLGDDSAVYLAREQGSSHHLVLKAQRRAAQRRAEADDRFRRAAEIAAGLDHPHIVPVTSSGTTEHLCWYTMEHQRASSLRLILATRGPLDVRSCQRIVAQIASALDHGHRRGLVHGDLKPENVLIDQDGWVRVCDALVARAIDPPVRISAPPPRPPHIAPEDWLEGMRTPSSDQYALGVLVHECLTAAPPVSRDAAPGAPLETLRPDLPIHITQAVQRALSPKPADRFPSVLDFVAALEAPGQMSLPGARPSGRATDMVLMIPDWKPPPGLGIPVRALLTIVAVAAVIIAGVVGGPRILRSRQRPIYDAGPIRPVVQPAAPADRSPDSASAPAERTARTGGTSPASRTPTTPRRRSVPATPESGAAAAPQRIEPRPAAAAAPAPAPAEASGRLSVNATPWGQVYLDGQLVGNTPKANLPVAPGTHTIRVVRDGFEPVERTVQVGAGQTVRVTDIVLTERQP